MPLFTGQKFGFGQPNAAGGPSGPTISASGGTKSTVGAYTVHKFTSSGSFTVASGTSTQCEVFLVGGGAAGGCDSGGGGGAGSCLVGTDITYSSSPGSYTVTIGAGGGGAAEYCPSSTPAPQWCGPPGDHGGESTTITHPGGTITAYGGNAGGLARAGGESYQPGPMSPGMGGLEGCGGGANLSSPHAVGTMSAGALATQTAAPPAGSFTFHRNKGGDATRTQPTGVWVGGGGGGAGGEGGNGTDTPGAGDGGQGGTGYYASDNIAWIPASEGVSGYFAGGGGGGAPDAPGGSGGFGEGLHGGGDGSEGNGSAGDGTANTGGGGGGDDNVKPGGAGGSGILYIAYPSPA